MADHNRRNLFKWLAGIGGILATRQVLAEHTDTHFEEQSSHRIVYQCNSADNEYLSHILFSAGELLRKYGDDVEIVVETFGPGLHLLGKKPGRPISAEMQAKASSLALYGIRFNACGNTMTGLNWAEDDLLPFANIVPIGVDDLMLLQEKGFSYVAW